MRRWVWLAGAVGAALVITGCYRLAPPSVDERRIELDQLARRVVTGDALTSAERLRLAMLLEAYGRAPAQAELIDAEVNDPRALAGRAWRGWALGRPDWPERVERAIADEPTSLAARALVVLLDAPLGTRAATLDAVRRRVATRADLPLASRCIADGWVAERRPRCTDEARADALSAVGSIEEVEGEDPLTLRLYWTLAAWGPAPMPDAAAAVAERWRARWPDDGPAWFADGWLAELEVAEGAWARSEALGCRLPAAARRHRALNPPRWMPRDAFPEPRDALAWPPEIRGGSAASGGSEAPADEPRGATSGSRLEAVEHVVLDRRGVGFGVSGAAEWWGVYRQRIAPDSADATTPGPGCTVHVVEIEATWWRVERCTSRIRAPGPAGWPFVFEPTAPVRLLELLIRSPPGAPVGVEGRGGAPSAERLGDGRTLRYRWRDAAPLPEEPWTPPAADWAPRVIVHHSAPEAARPEVSPPLATEWDIELDGDLGADGRWRGTLRVSGGGAEARGLSAALGDVDVLRARLQRALPAIAVEAFTVDGPTGAALGDAAAESPPSIELVAQLSGPLGALQAPGEIVDALLFAPAVQLWPPQRSTPLQPLRRRARIALRMRAPAGWRWEGAWDSFDHDGPLGRISQAARVEGEVLSAEWVVERSGRRVDVSGYRAVLEAVLHLGRRGHADLRLVSGE